MSPSLKTLLIRWLFFHTQKGIHARESDIDLIVVSEGFKDINLKERLEILGIAAGRVFEPIEAMGYTEEEIKDVKGTFLEEVLTRQPNTVIPPDASGSGILPKTERDSGQVRTNSYRTGMTDK